MRRAHASHFRPVVLPKYGWDVELRELGRSGIEVTRIALGCGNFGGIGSAPAFFGQGETRDEAFAVMDAAWGLGIRLFDTAASYGGGRSERWIGEWTAERGRRPTVATKVFHSVTGDPADQGLAPERIRRELAGSLERLGLERAELYLIHAPDPATPLEQTLAALDGLVRAGLVGAIGASNVDAAYVERALAISDAEGFARFQWVQNSYSLLEREAGRDVLPLCEREGLGFTPFGPLAGGWLTGKYRRGEPLPPGSRMTMRPAAYERFVDDRVFDALDAFEAAARGRGVDMATLALAWLLADDRVTSVIAGPRNPRHLEPAVAALALELTPAERDELTELFPPSP
jgi:aryl-alcohol dehydrogenase-like predicted oxidoreductase